MTSAPTLTPGDAPSPRFAIYEMTFEEYRHASFDGVAEWVDGHVEVDMSVGKPHFLIVDFLRDLIKGFLLVHPRGRLLAEPYAMRAVAGGNLRLPDLFFVDASHLDRFGDDALEGPADLCIEVVSPGSIEKDYRTKLLEYQANGVREYWVIDPTASPERVEFYVLALDPVHRGQLTFRPVPIDEDGIYRSTVIEGFWLQVGWLWDRTADAQRCLSEVVGAAAMLDALRQRTADR